MRTRHLLAVLHLSVCVRVCVCRHNCLACDFPPSLGPSPARCAVISSIPAGGEAEFQCPGMDGRYVNIFIPDTEEFLSLCEVQVFGSRLH